MNHNADAEVVFADGEAWKLDRAYIMGIINVTPDSFFSESRMEKESDFLKKVEQMVSEGVDIVDIGGVSSRPGSKSIAVEEERSRIVPKIACCKKEFPRVRISLDTTNEEIALEAADLGVDVINDISAGRFSDDKIFEVAKNYHLPFVLMHMNGIPETMQDNPVYKNGVFVDVLRFFDERLLKLADVGVEKKKIILDVGVGFGKKLQDNLTLFHEISTFASKGYALLVGASMKGMLRHLCRTENVDERIFGTVGVHLSALLSGANVIRVHHVGALRQAIAAFFATFPPKNLPFHLRHQVKIAASF